MFKCVGVDSKHNHIKHRLWTNLGKNGLANLSSKPVIFLKRQKAVQHVHRVIVQALLLLACKCTTLSEKDLNF